MSCTSTARGCTPPADPEVAAMHAAAAAALERADYARLAELATALLDLSGHADRRGRR